MYFQLHDSNVRLLGSMHLLPQGAEMPSWVYDAYQWSEIVCLEHDTEALVPMLKNNNGRLFQADVPMSVVKRYQSFWPKTGPVSPLSAMRPWAALMLAPVFARSEAGVSGVENHLRDCASRDGKPIAYLETPGQFIAAGESTPISEVRTALKLGLPALERSAEFFRAMFEAWSIGDIDGCEKVALQGPGFTPVIRAALLDSRNSSWAPRIREAIASGRRTLVAVGALHLAGPNSVQDVLGLPTTRLI